MSALRHLRFQERVVIVLGHDDWLLCESDLVEHWLQIECPLTDVVVLFEEIEVPRLQNKQVASFRIWSLHIEEKSVVEGSLTVLATIVRICCLLLIIAYIGLDEHVASSFNIFAWDIFGVHH